MISRDLIQPMVEAAKTTPFFFLEDVYLYGMLPEVIGNVTLVNLGLGGHGVFTTGNRRGVARMSRECVEARNATCETLVVFNGDSNVIRNMWKNAPVE